MFFEKLSRIFDKLASWSLARKMRRLHLQGINPQKFYVEEVRALMHTSTHTAQTLCENGVRGGIFEKHVELLDPTTHRTVATANSEEEFPLKIIIEPGLDHEDDEPQEVPRSRLTTMVYYSLSRGERREAADP